MKNLIIAFSLLFGTAALAGNQITLYGQPNYEPSFNCDRGTFADLTVTAVPAGGTVSLENFVGGMCEIMVDPDPRTYTLDRVEENNCGMITYSGSNAEGSITITDHRQSACEGVFMANFVVTENRNGNTNQMYSYDAINSNL